MTVIPKLGLGLVFFDIVSFLLLTAFGVFGDALRPVLAKEAGQRVVDIREMSNDGSVTLCTCTEVMRSLKER